MLEEIIDVSDTLLRLPFWFFLDLVLSARTAGTYNHVAYYFSWVSSVCPGYFKFSDFYIHLVLFAASLLCLLGAVLHTVGVLVLILTTLALTLVWVGSVVYSLLIRAALFPTQELYENVDKLVRMHFVVGPLLGLIVLAYFAVLALPRSVNIRKVALTGFLFTAFPLVTYIPVMYMTNATTLLASIKARSLENCSGSSPAWLVYAHALLPEIRQCLHPRFSCSSFYKPSETYSSHLLSSVCSPVCAADADPLRYGTKLQKIALNASPFLMFFSYLLLLGICVRHSPLGRRLIGSILEEFELYDEVGSLGFINFHWNRLSIPRALAFLWSFKVILVIVIGPKMWTILPAGLDQPQLYLNSSYLKDYYTPSDNQSTLSVLVTRAYVGAFVHGSETWLVVFGAAAFFGGLATLLVQFLVFLLDPTGESTAQLVAAAGDGPVDLHDWNVIEDPVVAMRQNDVLAVEMVAATGWNCAVVFLFMAFQYDLPSLPLTQRICCSSYGVAFIAITCIHPIQALIKSLLLHLDVPGRGSRWISHIRPLCFCFALIAASICILIYLPEGLAERVSKLATNDTTTSPVVVPRFGSSVESLKARQLRMILCGCQLLLELIVTLIEYVIYQISRRRPNWEGFHSCMFWTKIISSVLDYLISLVSFLTVCWLSIYDSIGMCRLFIIGYFYFILYPSTVRAYTWIRWRLLSKKRLQALVSPTEEELSVHGDNCPICYSDMKPETAKITRCGHLYHTECLSQWMRRQLFCPVCHADLLSTKVVNLRGKSNQAETTQTDDR
ncbi:unnamed protein product [Calicophoron daubneyi]|uniref:RING-type domain-containing protein n=1 Tax=Calicophoron daubneyi TaxID=300641 RepID=A0AAV2TFT3_CALDB